MGSALLSVGLVIGIAAILTVVVKSIKQPPIIAYIITGVLAGPLFLNLINLNNDSSELILIFAHMGVAFLLFIVGLSLDFRVLKEVGKVSALTGFSEILITAGVGFLIAISLGFGNLTGIYIAAALAFSSTVIIVKILSDKKEIDTLHGKLALGILIVEDFVAALALMAIPLIDGGGNIVSIGSKIAIIIGASGGVFFLSYLVLPKTLDYLAKNSDILFLFGIAWALLLATLFDSLGFSLEIGALIAGMSLASSKYTLELSGKIKPLRDFFVVLFFVFFGSQLAGEITSKLIYQSLVFSLFIIVGKPIIVMSFLRLFGYKKRTNFLAGSSLAQISEFSLIIVLLGFTIGHLTQETMSLVILISIITITVSSYSIYYSHWIFSKISHLLNVFEGKKEEIDMKTSKDEIFQIVVIGYHRIGYKILKSIRQLKMPFIVIDHNPKVILALRKKGINCIYGDAGDKYLLSEINLENAKLVISTIPEENSNLVIKERLKEINSKAVFIATAEQPRIALELYNSGVDYVIVPHHLGGDYIAEIIKDLGLHKGKYEKLGKTHYKELSYAKNKSKYS